MDMTNRVALVQPHCLRQMTPGDALLLHATLPPAYIATRRWFEDRTLRARAETPIPDHLRRASDPENDPRSDKDADRRHGDLDEDDATAGVAADVEAALRRLELLAAPQPAAPAAEADT
jgi:type IV secretory pathway TraG/TraD family ATPase VirD4